MEYRVYDNGIYRDMTEEEVAEYNNHTDSFISAPKSYEERLTEIEQNQADIYDALIELADIIGGE